MCYSVPSGYIMNSSGEMVPGGPMAISVPAGYRMNSAGNLEYIGPRPSSVKFIQRCPVCHGTGFLPNGFYTIPPGVEYYADGNSGGETCRSCGGNGTI